MIKTIKVKKEMNFIELMEYIIQNDIRDRIFRSRKDDRKFYVSEDGCFDFLFYRYNNEETYEVEFEEEITEDTEFEKLIEIYNKIHAIAHPFASIRKIKDSTTDKIYALIDGELQLVWERDSSGEKD